MGSVYKARDPEIDRTVALKTINPLLLTSKELRDEFLERFRREARAAGRLSHPHIVSVYDLGTDEATSTPFIVMEYVTGVSLEAVLKENPSLPLDQAVEILEQVASALQEAHRNGVIHRDVKPANVFLDARGRVKVGDFGIARIEGSELTQAGVGLGTPGYSAPEVLRGGLADARSDVFALGVLAYRLLTGQRPFAGTTREGTAIDIVEQVPRPPHAVRPEIPEPVSSAIMRALAKSPAERTASAEAFAVELRNTVEPTRAVTVPRPAGSEPALPVTPVPASTITVATPPRIHSTRGWLIAVLVAVAALAVVAVLALREPSAPGATRAPGTLAPNRGEPPAARGPGPTPAARRPAVPPPDGGRTEDLAREAQKRIEERLREEWKKATEEAKKAQERGRKKDKKGRGRGGERE